MLVFLYMHISLIQIWAESPEGCISNQIASSPLSIIEKLNICFMSWLWTASAERVLASYGLTPRKYSSSWAVGQVATQGKMIKYRAKSEIRDRLIWEMWREFVGLLPGKLLGVLSTVITEFPQGTQWFLTEFWKIIGVGCPKEKKGPRKKITIIPLRFPVSRFYLWLVG